MIITVGATAVSVVLQIPIGRQFTMALAGTLGGLTSFKAQWSHDGNTWRDFVSTDLDLAAAGEAIGYNVGGVNNIRFVSAGNNGTTNMVAVVNVVPIDRALM